MIPKIIHLCWFSGDAYPPLVKKCIDSWQKKMPEYEIKIWTSEMAEQIGLPYIHEALSMRKWAFAVDVVRLYALKTMGGIYLDSDVFVKKNLESLLCDDFVSAMEYHRKHINHSMIDEQGNRLVEKEIPISCAGIQAAFMASVPNHYFVNELLSYYSNRHFILSDGTLDTAIIAPAHYAIVAESYGFKYVDKKQELKGITIHPSKYIAGFYTEDNKEAYAIHCCNHSWGDFSIIDRMKIKFLQIFRNFSLR